jgi:antitoxin (DNA-binding transcriptional repressor) of toxin-antitoxin stability system
MTKVSVRDLRNRFAKIKRLVESEGEVIVTDNATPRYRLTLYTPPGTKTKPVAKDYIERMKRHQPRPLAPQAAQALDEANRGGR